MHTSLCLTVILSSGTSSSVYSLIKMLYWMCEKTKMPLTGPQLLHAIKRNFGGLEDKNLDPVQEFLRRLPSTIDHPPDMRNVPYEVSHAM